MATPGPPQVTLVTLEVRLAQLSEAVKTRTELEKEWRETDRKEREKRDSKDRDEREKHEKRQHQIIILLISAVLLLAGFKVLEIVGLIP